MMIPDGLKEHRELATAIAAARLAGEQLLSYRELGFKTEEKGAKNNLVTNADLAAEKAITTLISEEFPQHKFLAEEEHADHSSGSTPEHLWVIDPLDGTTNFIHGLPHFATSIGYYNNGQPICGVVFNPARNDLYLAVRGEGAFHNGKPIHVGGETKLDEVLVGVGFYYDRGDQMRSTLKMVEKLFEQQIRGIRRMGTASLDLCQVACGNYGAFFELQLSPWDFAAGRLIVEEAGGCVTNALGAPLPVEPTSLLASNLNLHSAMLEITNK